MLAYLLREKCPVPDTTVGAAVEVGQIGLAKWLVAQGCVVNDGSLVMAVRGGHIECVQWLVHDVGVKVTDMLIYNSVGNLAFLEWLDSEEHHPLVCSPHPAHKRTYTCDDTPYVYLHSERIFLKYFASLQHTQRYPR